MTEQQAPRCEAGIKTPCPRKATHILYTIGGPGYLLCSFHARHTAAYPLSAVKPEHWHERITHD